MMDAKAALNTQINGDGFNPRARDGRESLIHATEFKKGVSIHAPVMDANKSKMLLIIPLWFQSTRP